MNSTEPNLGKEAIDNRFISAVIALMERDIVTTQGEVAQTLGVKPAKFSEIMNGRMHVGVDMLAELSEYYHVSADWLLMGRGHYMFRKSSIPPELVEYNDLILEHPYEIEDEEEMLKLRIKKVEEEEQEQREIVITPTLMAIISDKDKTLLAQAEEIGRLKAENNELRRHLEKNASAASIDSIAPAAG